MSVRVFEGKDGEAVVYCSTSGFAFGPVMQSADVAHAFLNALAVDARTLSNTDMERAYAEFVRVNVCECGELRKTECFMCKSPLFENAVDGVHVEFEDTETTTFEKFQCEFEPEPVSGERYVCGYCRRNA